MPDNTFLEADLPGAPFPPNVTAEAAEEVPTLSDDDEVRLRSLGHWIYARERDEAMESTAGLFIAPPSPPSTRAELEARADAVLSRRHRWLRSPILSHIAVAAAAALVVQLWPASPVPHSPAPDYALELRGGDGRTFGGTDEERIYTPDSTFEFKLRSDRAIDEPVEVVIRAERVDAPGSPPVLVRVGSELFEPNDRGMPHVITTTSSILPLTAGRWALTFEVGAPEACLLPASSDPTETAPACTRVDRTIIELRERGGEHAP